LESRRTPDCAWILEAFAPLLLDTHARSTFFPVQAPFELGIELLPCAKFVQVCFEVECYTAASDLNGPPHMITVALRVESYAGIGH